jgi:hypothetical protein
MVFGRKKKDRDEDETAVSASTVPEVEERVPTTGPWDEADVTEDEERPRLDLGSIRVPVPEDVELRVDVGEDGQVAAATAIYRGSTLQINAFAAPRREGIWADVRAEIREALLAQGGHGEDVDGPFGTELRARVPTGNPGSTSPARFLGVDGPRWFLRGLLTGPAVSDATQAQVLLDLFREVVVHRGTDAMAPRDPLPLRLPKEAREAHEAAMAQAAGEPASSGDFNPFERGPEITETR